MSTPLRVAPFLFALLCLLLPFAQVSCDSKDQHFGKVAEVNITGWELMTGNKSDIAHPQQPQPQQQSRDPNYLLLAVSALLVLGLLAAASPVSRKIALICGVASAACLIYLSTHLREAILTQDIIKQPLGQGELKLPFLDQLQSDLLEKGLLVTAQPGIYAAIACAVLAAIFCALPDKQRSL
jgi:hypothetical protein